ncbi:hypothetical protein BJF93_01125 [Xaviernesmea oryzae]|uniref:Glycosyltransferase n=1 Tax=Xaviernesmea oryzae TaxID=464029 RepID=A0A1Q9B240_9HYPH|nr:glycosyltransferase family 4 protein [Xaviernesmea oryzae]OLP62085.1 hypothetical protein BJF93_01125 [Xaviernesmea oryzae]SEL86900.1 Glycosyltransferase involved in cell wall bisynthesis [Xaviernesmea oryzae]
MSAAGARPLRLLMTLDAVGGVWRYAMDLASELKVQGVATVFVGFGPPPGGSERRQAQAIGELVWLDESLDWLCEGPQALSGVGPALSRLAEIHNVDVLHLNLPTQAVGLDTARPVLVVSHSCVPTWFAAVRGSGPPQGWDWHVAMNREGLLRADAVVSPSASHARALGFTYGAEIKATVVENATRLNETILPRDQRVFAAGRWWDEGKNGAMLDEAAAMALWSVEMAGPLTGPNGQSLTLSHAKGLGVLPHCGAMARLASAGIVASPSLYEPFGLAALEGARSGAALVLSDIPTYRELWDDAALFAPPDDPQAFARAINRLTLDSDLRGELGERARLRARRFTPQAQADAMAALYWQLVDARDPAVPAAKPTDSVSSSIMSRAGAGARAFLSPSSAAE